MTDTAPIWEPPVTPSAYPSIRRWLAPSIAGALLLTALSSEDGPVLCPIRRCTGGYCPLCGATRSVGSLARFDFVESLRRYPALPLLALVVVVRLWPRPVPDRLRNSLLISIGAATVLIWFARLAAGDIPRPSSLALPW